MQQNYYQLLDVPFSANRSEITKAYRQQMRIWHPDQFRGSDKSLAEEYAKQLNQAYNTLSDPKRRDDYDRSMRVQVIQDQIMERYVSGASSWNTNTGSAHAPRRPLSARERREKQQSDRLASRHLVVMFGLFGAVLVAALLLLSILTSMGNLLF